MIDGRLMTGITRFTNLHADFCSIDDPLYWVKIILDDDSAVRNMLYLIEVASLVGCLHCALSIEMLPSAKT